MRNLLKILILMGLTLLLTTPTQAQYNRDSLQISLLTASPGTEVYERFGHTALRVIEKGGKLDLIFNYGLFSFDTPNFIYRFVKGETDYQLGINQMPYFAMEYAMRGSRVTEQVINISPLEAENVLRALQENYLPQNRIYRYNFFFDNCSTRPRNILEKNIEGEIQYFNPGNETTFREMVYRMTDKTSWLSFGIDLTFGEKADRPITYRQEMFLPEILEQAFETARIETEAGSRSLVRETIVLVQENPEETEIAPQPFLLSPIVICWFLFFLFLTIALFELKRGRIFSIVDTFVFLPAGMTGCVLFFLNFVSTHPVVDHNFNCIWLQPLDLFAAVFVWVKSTKKILYYYHFANFVILLLLLICYAWIPQHFNAAFFPIIGIIMMRSALHIIFGLKKTHFS